MQNFRQASKGDPLSIPADWFNQVSGLLKPPTPSGADSANGGIAPPLVTIVKVSGNLGGNSNERYHTGQYLAHEALAMTTGSAPSSALWFPATALADCVIVSWFGTQTSGKVFVGVHVGYAANASGTLLPAYHAAGGASSGSIPAPNTIGQVYSPRDATLVPTWGPLIYMEG